jgi:hypothetical protein
LFFQQVGSFSRIGFNGAKFYAFPKAVLNRVEVLLHSKGQKHFESNVLPEDFYQTREQGAHISS